MLTSPGLRWLLVQFGINERGRVGATGHGRSVPATVIVCMTDIEITPE